MLGYIRRNKSLKKQRILLNFGSQHLKNEALIKGFFLHEVDFTVAEERNCFMQFSLCAWDVEGSFDYLKANGLVHLLCQAITKITFHEAQWCAVQASKIALPPPTKKQKQKTKKRNTKTAQFRFNAPPRLCCHVSLRQRKHDATPIT